MAKQLESQLHDLNAKLDDSSRNSQEMGSVRNRMDQENQDLGRQIEEIESQLSQMSKQKAALQKQMEEAKNVAEEEGSAYHMGDIWLNGICECELKRYFSTDEVCIFFKFNDG